jgi:hypothetical protein
MFNADVSHRSSVFLIARKNEAALERQCRIHVACLLRLYMFDSAPLNKSRGMLSFHRRSMIDHALDNQLNVTRLVDVENDKTVNWLSFMSASIRVFHRQFT